MEKTGCKINFGAPTTLAVKGLMMMMMTQTLYRLLGRRKDSVTQLKCSEKIFFFSLVFEGRDSSRVSDVLGEVVPDVRTEIGERAKAMSFAVETSEFEYA